MQTDQYLSYYIDLLFYALSILNNGIPQHRAAFLRKHLFRLINILALFSKIY